MAKTEGCLSMSWHPISGVKPDTVNTWIGKKNLPAHKMGRIWKMKRSEVDTWARSGRAAAKLRSAKTGKPPKTVKAE